MDKLRRYEFINKAYPFCAIVFLWYLLHIIVDSPAIPSPFDAFKNFITILPGTLLIHIGMSFVRIVAAILISLVAGSIIGVLIGMNKKADILLSPIIYVLYPLPKIAFMPILMILFGIGEKPKILLIIFIIIFQFILAARDGIKDIPKEIFLSVYSLGLGRLHVYRHLVIPGIMSKVITATRNTIGISISVLFFSENFATSYGIGYFIMNSWSMVNYVEMFSGIIALGLMGLLLFKAIDIIEKYLCPWTRLKNNFIENHQ